MQRRNHSPWLVAGGALSLLALASPLCARPASRPARGGPARLPAGVKVIADVEYTRVGDKPLQLDLYLPQGHDPKAARLPVVVWVHGGAWRAGTRKNTPAPAVLVPRGYAVASVTYRLSQEAKWPAQIQDCKAAVRWLRAHADEYGLDPDRFGAWGSSAGGHLVAMLGTAGDVKELEGGGEGDANQGHSSRVQAVCDWFGPTDFLKMDEQAPPNARQRHSAPESPESQLIGGTVTEHPEKVKAANPITYVSKDDPPFLIMHGDKDNLVPLGQSEILRDALEKAGVDVTLHVVRGAGHGFGGPEISAMVVEFFDRHLKAAKGGG